MLQIAIESLISEREMSRDTANQYRKSIACFSEFLGRPAEYKDLTEQNVNSWLLHLSGKLNPDTVRGRRTGVVCLWNYLAELGEVPAYNPRRMRRVKRSQAVPQAWSLDQVRVLLKAAETVPGRLRCGLAAAEMLRAWILVAYETGLRTGDIMRLRVDAIAGHQVSLIQHKTRKPHCARLSDAALAAIAPLVASGRRYLFGLPLSTARRWELHLFRRAEKLGFQRRYRQGLGTLRKTHGTEVCRISDINAAAISLGHCSGSTIARRHYVQPDALGVPVSPPLLLGGSGDETSGLGSGD